MKILKTICLLSLCIFMITACGSEATTDTATKAKSNTIVPHDHDGDGIPDHGPGEHGKAKKAEVTPEQEAALAAKKAAREAAKNAPATAAEKATAKALCACLNQIPTLSKIIGITTQQAFNAAAAGQVADVKAMQACHSKVISAAIEKVDGDKGIHAFKARKLANADCLKSDNDDLWFLMGKFVADSAGATKIDQ